MPEIKSQQDKFICAYDLPEHVSRTFHRRLRAALDEFGGKTQCQATQSVYIFSGENARTAAYTIALLAETFGAQEVYVAQITEIAPQVHFDEMARARQIVDNLTVNRRTKSGKLAPRSVCAMAGADVTDEKIIEFPNTLAEVRQHQATQHRKYSQGA